jgi:hypothetical protein
MIERLIFAYAGNLLTNLIELCSQVFFPLNNVQLRDQESTPGFKVIKYPPAFRGKIDIKF